MSDPFFIVDHKNCEIKIVIANVVKTVKFSEISSKMDFIDEILRVCKTVRLVSHYSEVNKDVVLEVLDGLIPVVANEVVREVVEVSPVKGVNSDSSAEAQGEDVENSPLIRKNTEKRICVDDLDMKFNSNADYFDLSSYDADKVNSSLQLKFFLDRGYLVRTNMEEMSRIKSKVAAEKTKADELKDGRDIIDREGANSTSATGEIKEDGDGDSMLVVSGVSGAGADQPEIDEGTVIDTDGGQLDSGEIGDFFFNENADSERDAGSIDSLLRKT